MSEDNQKITDEKFWNAVVILCKNLPTIYKKLSGSVNVKTYKILNGINNLGINDFTFNDKTLSFVETFERIISCNDGTKMVPWDSVNDEEMNDYFRHELSKNSIQGMILIKKLLLKSFEIDAVHCLQVINFVEKKIVQICSSEIKDFKEKFSYEIKIINNDDNSKEIQINSIFSNDCCNHGNWLESVLKPKFLKWMNSPYRKNEDQVISHKLIDSEKFSLLYKKLKQKYGMDLIKSWTECTDPKKFVYEDISIATYLILLWEVYEKCVNFVDLGCGNGLLVYILNSEGYNGYGIDIKKRKIWNTYPVEIQLKLLEQQINPITFNINEIDKNINWLIGNHSDELSAWIPIKASLNSYNTKYFLLPCCAYELSGSKYQRKNSKLSVYEDFTNYVKIISETQCNFVTLLDRLKIPSTKRIALIGTKHTYNIKEYNFYTKQLKENVLEKLNLADSCYGDNNVPTSENYHDNENSNKIKLREKDQIVRNCTQIDKNIIKQIVLKLFKILLNDNDNDEEKLNNADGIRYCDCLNNTKNIWNHGTTIEIPNLVKHLNKDELKVLKSECGGIKTLLKNKHEIFNVNGNEISIKCPKKRKNSSIDKMTCKKRKCFFFYNHPNKCLLNNEECTFIHDENT